MAFNKARYVTVCQQVLVTALVSAVGLTAAGVMTLDIVPPREPAPSASSVIARDLAPAVHVQSGYVDTAPVTPKVREVALETPAVTARRATPAVPVEKGATVVRGRVLAQPPTATIEKVHGLPVAITSAPQAVSGYATVGVTWQPGINLAEDQIALQIRTRKAGVWSGWQKLQYHDDHGPDASDSESSAERPGTDPLVIGDVDQVQMRAGTFDGAAPAGMQLAVIDPGTGAMAEQAPAIDTSRLSAADESATGAPVENTSALPASTQDAASTGDIALSAMKVSPKPQIFSRAQWGANEKIRESGLPDYGTIKTGFVHHTVNANNYSKADVPALLRGIYAYHVISRGWRDIGYNFLVDRFGRIWEGRYGGVDRPVVGAHTLGFNEVSFAMSAIGNFDIAQPPQVVLDAYAKLFAWKLSMYNIPADASGLKIKGRTLHAINGHRDVGQTACPGRYLYAKIPSIRVAAAKIQQAAQGPTYSPTQKPAKAVAQRMTSFPTTSSLAGSGWPDLVVQDATGALSVLPTGGMVGYNPPVSSHGAWAKKNRIVAVGDLNGDRRGDVLAKRKGQKRWGVYLGDASNHIRGKMARPRGVLASARTILAGGDWNKDGRTDVLIRKSGSRALFMCPGKGNTHFGTCVQLASDWSRFRSTTFAGDLNRDGRPDLVMFDGSRLWIAFSTKTGLGTPVAKRQLGKKYNAVVGGGDLTGDGIGDVLLRTAGTGQAIILPGTGKKKGPFGHFFGPYPGFGGLRQVSAAPMVAGGRPAVVGRAADGRLKVLANNGRVNLLPRINSQRTTAISTAVYAVGDWNGDGIADVITRHGTDGDKLVLNRGMGNGVYRGGVTMANGWKTVTNLAAVGDVTGDGHPDLMGQVANGPMVIFPGDGSTGFLKPRLAPASMRTFNQVGGTTWRPRALPGSILSSSDGSFVPFAGTQPNGSDAMRMAGSGSASVYDWMIGSGDVNGDGRADLLGRQRSDGTLWLIPGTTSGFGQRMFVGSGLGKYRIAG